MSRLRVTSRSRALRIDERALERYFVRLAETLRLGGNVEADVTFVGPGAIRALKREHFGQDVETDCIAFGVDMGPLPGGVRYLGQMVLCPSVARANARRLGRTFPVEMLFVFTHGVLHLTGRDDATERARRKMWADQESLMARLAPRRPIFSWRGERS